MQTCLYLLAGILSFPAAEVALEHDPKLDVYTATLANGLHVVLAVRPAAPVVSVWTGYKVGSKDEAMHETGLAHFLEHMMFKGTRQLPKGAIDLATQQHGGSNNAFTSNDFTAYFFEFPAEHLQVALRIEADRMRNCVLDFKEFEAEKAVVVQEIGMNDDSPWSRMTREAEALAYLVHPYHHPVLGWQQEIERLRPEDMRAFYERYYQPNNATLIVAGAFDPQAAFEQIEQLFGALERVPEPARSTRTEPEKRGVRTSELIESVNVPRLTVVFRTVRTTDPEDVVLDCIARIVGSGKTARLYRRLVQDDQTASQVSASNDTRVFPGLFQIDVEGVEGADGADIEEALFDELDALATDGPDAHELERAKNGILARQVFARETASGVAQELVQFDATATLDYLRQYDAQLAAVSADQVREVCDKFLHEERAVIVWSLPEAMPEPEPPQEPARTSVARGRHGHSRSPRAPGPSVATRAGATGIPLGHWYQSEMARPSEWVPGVESSSPQVLPCWGLAARPSRLDPRHPTPQRISVALGGRAAEKVIARPKRTSSLSAMTRLSPEQAIAQSPVPPRGRAYYRAPAAAIPGVAAGAAAPIVAAPRLDVVERTLPNGLTVLLMEKHDQPVLALEAHVRAGQRYEPVPGLAYLMGKTLETGAGERSEEEIADAIEFVGGSLDASGTGVSVQTLAKDAGLALDLLADLLEHPTFPEDAVERERTIVLAEIAADQDEPRQVADQLFRKLIYGAHPFARDAKGTADTVQRISRDDLIAFHQKFFVPNNTVLCAVGDFQASEMERLIAQRLGKWQRKELEPPAIPVPTPPEERQEELLEQDRAQVNVYIGHLGITRKDPDYVPLRVMDNIFGVSPGFTDRLSSHIRDELGLCYTVTGGIASSAGEEPGMFRAFVGTRPDQWRRASAEIVQEVQKITSEPVSDDELANAKVYLTGSYVFRFQRASDVADIIIDLYRYGLGFDYPERYLEAIQAVTPEQILQVAQQHLHPDRLVTVAVGKVAAAGDPRGN